MTYFPKLVTGMSPLADGVPVLIELAVAACK